jgi:predicted RNA-binding Zn ribbon-like protein
MREEVAGPGTFKLIAGRLCLDFANTVDWRTTGDPQDSLQSYSDLVAWSQQAGIVTDQQALRLLEEARRRPRHGRAALAEAIRLREAISRTLHAVFYGESVPAEDMDTLNSALSQVLARSQIMERARGFSWEWAGAEDALDRPLWPVVRDALDLLTSEDLSRVGVCAGDGCGWLFLDKSRNHSRRWCAMEDCGNRAKARRYYERRRAAQVST